MFFLCLRNKTLNITIPIINPYSIFDSNDSLLELVNIDISGLDEIFGTQIGFQNQSDDGTTQSSLPDNINGINHNYSTIYNITRGTYDRYSILGQTYCRDFTFDC